MKKSKINLLLAVGFVLFAIAKIGIYISGGQNNLLHAFNGLATALVIAGAAWQILIHHGVNHKIRQWKLHLVGKEAK